MNTKVETRFKDASPRETTTEQAFVSGCKGARSQSMKRQCTNCGSTAMRKVSLAYEQGVSHTTAKTRLRGFWLGDFMLGQAVTHATHESQLSVRLRRPAKSSYGKVIRWSALLSVVPLIAYVHSVMAHSTPASSLGPILYLVLLSAVLMCCLFLVWRRNTFLHPRELERWNRSFLCQRCGEVSEDRSRDW